MPDYYRQTSRNGEALSSIGQLCGDRLGIGLTNDCIYWRHPSERCKFCSIGLNLKTETRRKTFNDIIEVIDAALNDSVSPARHILLGGGTPSGPDAGALGIAQIARAIRMQWDVPIYAMIAAPLHNDVLYELHHAGVTELGMNIELFDRNVARELMPGKHQAIGLERYLEALALAAGIFGKYNARSIMIVGLESMESTLKGVDLLASIGVLPILSPFRPFAGTILGERSPPSFEFLWETLEAATEVAAKHDMPLGPLCIPCQGNTLTIPNHPAYLS
ncbi:MAG: radical SAM protein [Candidatus Contendobacter sp.]|nr:radical SAM protein [Candidatus Contendobacter sp.]